MKTLITTTTIILVFIFLCGSSFGQERTDSLALKGHGIQMDSLKKIRPEFYRKSMGLDSAKAARVAGVQDAYKAAMQLVVQDSSLTLDVQRERMRTLMMERNRKLRGLLNPEQQQKVIPTTELNPEKTETISQISHRAN